jgi:nitrogen regulatory protein PII
MTLQTERRTVLTVITESAIEKNLLRDLEQMGVRGYTIVDARGQGRRGVRTTAWGEAANIRIEVICTRALAEKVLEDFLARYYDNFAMVAYLQDVEIIRPDKF